MHGNAILRQIQRQGLRQPHAAELRRAVAGVVLAAHFARLGVDLDNAPLNAIADHQFGELAGAEEIAHQVNLQRAVKIPQREVADKRRLGDPGAIDQQIGATKNLIDAARQRQHALLAGGVGTKAIGHPFAILAVNFLCDCRRFITLNINYRHAVPFCGKPTAEERPEGLSSTNDNGNLFHTLLLRP